MKPWLGRTRIVVRDVQEQLRIRPNATHVIMCSDTYPNNYFVVDAWEVEEHTVSGFYEEDCIVSFSLGWGWRVVKLDTVEYMTNAEAALEQHE